VIEKAYSHIFFQHLFGGTLNKLGWLLQYSANVLSSEFYYWSETILFNGQINNTHDERPLSLFTIPRTVKIMLFPKPVGRTARKSSPFCGLLTARLCPGFKTTFLSFDFKKF